MNISGRKMKLIILLLLVAGTFLIAVIQFSDKNTGMNRDSITVRQALRGIALAKYHKEEQIDNYLKSLKSDKIIDKIPHKNTILTYKSAKEIVGNLNIKSDEIEKLLEGSGNVSGEKWNKIFEYIYLTYGKDDCFETKDIIIVGYNNGKIICKSGEYISQFATAKAMFGEYADEKQKAMIYKDEIIYFCGQSTKEVVYENVWIMSSDNRKTTVYMYGTLRKYYSTIKEEVSNVVADIRVVDGKLSHIVLKKDTINGKVLSMDDNNIEVEGFGKVPLSENFCVYKDYGEVELVSKKDILVGYSLQDFVVAGGKICAAIIHSSAKADSIRVLLKTNDFSDIYHNNAVISCDSDYRISYGKNKSRIMKAGKKLKLTNKSRYLENGRIKIQAVDGKTRIKVESIKRSYGTPIYRGSLEISASAKGLILVNELSMEEYLYSVVASEMPSSYGKNALAVQAVCARTYAYRQVLDNSYSEYGAHVDDSVSFQVYNNVKETKESVDAVKSTYGKIITYKNEAIQAFFFSTSCGATSEADIWGGKNLPYIRSRYLSIDKNKDLSNEKVFDSFIRKSDETFDSEFDLYRWKVSVPGSKLSYSVNRGIGGKYVGEITDINPLERGKGGSVNRLLIIGTDGEVQVDLQGNIRKLLDISGCRLIAGTGKIYNSFSMLPSACFVVDKDVDENGESVFTFYGGGYGHGVGMSQNATKSMADEGMTMEEIIKFFYKDIEISDAYSL